MDRYLRRTSQGDDATPSHHIGSGWLGSRVIAVLAVVAVACGTSLTVDGNSDGGHPDGWVDASTIDAEWPLTVDGGVLRCDKGFAVVLNANGVDYAINGTAITWADQEGYVPVDEVWRDNPDIEGTKISIGPLIELGLERCE